MTDPTHFGRYRVTGVLGRGAMGVVYLAEDPVITRQVAIKVIQAVEGAEAELQARFDLEFRSAGTLSHPNVVTVYDVGKEGDAHFIALEYVEGQSLETILEARRSLPVEQVVELTTQICDALDYAHRAGIVHRDIKPANILVTAEGRPKITDFGVAKLMGDAAKIRTGIDVTREGSAIGTPAYMSPEQALSHPVTGASDQFSVGVMLYRMLTGERPFVGENLTTVMYRIVHEHPTPPNTLNPRVSPALAQVVMRALAKNPAARYPSCGELAQAIEATAQPAAYEQTLVLGGGAAGPSATAAVTSMGGGSETWRPQAAVPEPSWLARHWMALAGAGIAAALAVGWLAFGGVASPEVAPQDVESGPAATAVESMTMAVESDSPGARIWLDGVDLGVSTPAEIALAGQAGQRVQLELRRDGVIEASGSFVLGPNLVRRWAPQVAAGAPAAAGASPAPVVDPAPVAPAPVVASERFTITTSPPGARVFLDGQALAGVTPASVDLEPDREYELRTELDGHNRAGLTFELSGLTESQRQSQSLHFPLTPTIPPGRLVVSASYPVSLEIRPASGEGRTRTVDAAPGHDLSLPRGRYVVTMVAPDVFLRRDRAVEIEEGGVVELPVPEAVSVRVVAFPSNCRVSINGRDSGVTPFTVEMAVGRHEFEFEWPALGESVTLTEQILRDQQVFASQE